MKKISIYAALLTALFTLQGLYTQAQTVNTTNVTSGAAFNVFGTDTVTVWGNLYNKGTITINSSGTLRFFGDSVVNTSTATTAGSGTMQYVGKRPAPYAKSATQYTTGPVSLYNVLVNDSNGSTFNGNITISNNLILKRGMITADTVIVTNASASALSAYMTDPTQSNYTKSGYVNGILKRAITGTGQYDFPIGTSTNYELISIVGSSLTGTGTLTATYTTSNGSCSTPNPDSVIINGTPVQSLLNGGYWTVAPDAEPTGGSYSAYVNERGYTTYPGAASQMTLIKRSNCASAWKLLGSATNSTQAFNSNTATAQRTGLTSFSDFGIGWGDEALALTLTAFDAAWQNNNAAIAWTTANEINSAGFDIERSMDGTTFTTISNVPTKAVNGNSHSALTYTYSDVNIKPEVTSVVYYRLRHINTNGSFEYSTIVPLSNNSSKGNIISIYPNPVTGSTVTLLANVTAAANGLVRIYDALGRQLSAQTVSFNAGANTFTLDVSQLPAGIYVLNTTINDEVYTNKLVVVR